MNYFRSGATSERASIMPVKVYWRLTTVNSDIQPQLQIQSQQQQDQGEIMQILTAMDKKLIKSIGSVLLTAAQQKNQVGHSNYKAILKRLNQGP